MVLSTRKGGRRTFEETLVFNVAERAADAGAGGAVPAAVVLGEGTTPNQAPMAYEFSIGVAKDRLSGIRVRGTDADRDEVRFVIASQPGHGRLGVFNGDVVEYMPQDGYTGPDSFTYRATDGRAESEIATVRLHVAPLERYLEPEHAEGLEAAGWQVEENASARGGLYIVHRGTGSTQTPPERPLTWPIDVPSDGAYRLYLRVQAPSWGADSAWVKIDGVDQPRSVNAGREDGWVQSRFGQRCRSWRWRQVRSTNRDLSEFYLTAGRTTLRLGYAKPGLRIDSLYICNVDATPPGAVLGVTTGPDMGAPGN
jgi:hypothetical protein